MTLYETAADDNERALVLLDDSLRWSRNTNRARLTELLESVRTEIVFELELSRVVARLPERRTGNGSGTRDSREGFFLATPSLAG